MRRCLVLRHLEPVEPLLRATCTHELAARTPIGDVGDALVRIGRGDGEPDLRK